MPTSSVTFHPSFINIFKSLRPFFFANIFNFQQKWALPSILPNFITKHRFHLPIFDSNFTNTSIKKLRLRNINLVQFGNINQVQLFDRYNWEHQHHIHCHGCLSISASNISSSHITQSFEISSCFSGFCNFFHIWISSNFARYTLFHVISWLPTGTTASTIHHVVHS